MKTLNHISTIGIAVIIMMMSTSCAKNSVRPGKLKGHVWNVEEYYILTGSEGTNYATWQNTGVADRVDYDNVLGTWDISKDGEVKIDMSYTGTNYFTGEPEPVMWSWEGWLDMRGRQSSFGLENEYDYEQYLVHEKGAKRITLYKENLWNASATGDVIFITLTR